jgi:hypothetical protein
MPSRAQRLRLLLAAALPAALLAQGAPAAAAPPANDARAAAQPVGALAATLRGTTVDATLDEDEPFSGCGGPGKSSVWYALRSSEARAIIVALDAGGEMDATVDVFERRRSQLSPVDCQATDTRGEATIELDAAGGTDYLIRVAPLANSVSEAFTLRVIAPDRAARPPGQGLPAGGASAQVDRFANPDDAWAVRLTAGRTYRMNFVNPGRRGCPSAQLYAPGAADFEGQAVRVLECDAQTTYTPPESGRYTIHVRAPRASRARLPYRLRIGRAGRDDTAPGIELANDDRVGGSLAGAELDALDLYRFSVSRRSDLRVRLETARNFHVLLLSDGGKRLACGCGPAGRKQLERRIAPGRYFLAVRARDGDGGRYVLARLARTITSSTTLAGAKRSSSVPSGAAINLSLRVSPAVDGRATLLVERFDPLAGWLFDATFHPRLAGGLASVSFRPRAVGRWRVSGGFDGTRRASPSDGGTATFTVTEPVTDG